MGEIGNCVESDENEVEVPAEAANLDEDHGVQKTAKETANIKGTENAEIEANAKAAVKQGGTKPVRNLTDQEYEEIFKAVLERYSPVKQSQEKAKVQEDDFETIIKDDEHMASHYVEAFVSDSQNKDDNLGAEVQNNEEEANKGVQIDGEQIQEFDDDIVSEDLQAMNENTPELQIEKPAEIKAPSKKKVRSFRKKTDRSSKVLKLQSARFTGEMNKKKRNIHNTRETHAKRLPGLKEGKLASKEFPVDDSCERKNKSVSKKQIMQERKFLETGTWVQCGKTTCLKWRYLEDVQDPASIPEMWTCSMKPGQSCASPEDEWDENVHSKEFVFTKFTEGSVVWARMAGYPWWPGIIEIDPDFQTFFECTGSNKNVATGYHVVFLDEKVSRAWIQIKLLKPFDGEKKLGSTIGKEHNYYKAIERSSAMAQEAVKMPIKERLHTFGFAKRFKGKWGHEVAANEVLDTGPSTSGFKSKRVKTKKQSSRAEGLKSPSVSQKSTEDTLLKTLGMERKEVEFYLENAEAIIKGAESVLEEFYSSQSKKSQNTDDSEYEDEKPKAKKRKLPSKPAKPGTSSSRANKENAKKGQKEKTLEPANSKSIGKGKAPLKGNKGLKKGKTPKAAQKPLETRKLNEGETEDKISNAKDKPGNEVREKEDTTATNETTSVTEKKEPKKNKEKGGKASQKKMAQKESVAENTTEKRKPSFPTFTGKKKTPQFGIPLKKRKTDCETSEKAENKKIDSSKQEKVTTTPEKAESSATKREAEKVKPKEAMTFDPDIFTMDTNETQKEQGERDVKDKEVDEDKQKVQNNRDLESDGCGSESIKKPKVNESDQDEIVGESGAKETVQEVDKTEVAKERVETEVSVVKPQITEAADVAIKDAGDGDNSDFDFEDE